MFILLHDLSFAMASDIAEYFKKLKKLTNAEREADKSQSEDSNKPLRMRAEEGIAWYPVSIVYKKKGPQGEIRLEIRRDEHVDVPHEFKVGRTVFLFNELGGTNDKLLCRILALYQVNYMLVAIVDDIDSEVDLPSWLDYGRLGLELSTDIPTFNEMDKALDKCIKAKVGSRLRELQRVLVGEVEACFNNKYLDLPPLDIKLNESQEKAVLRILNAKDVAIIHGPPGTGKTTTLVESVKLIVQSEKQILVTAPSNTAVDLLTQKISEAGISVLRIGNPNKINNELVKSCSLDRKMEEHPEYKLLKELREFADDCKKIIKGNKKHPLKVELSVIKDEIKKLEKHILKHLLSTAKVITTTLGSANHKLITGIHFSTLFIDEAGQALEPACWIAITKADRVIMAGDHKQLPPVVKLLDEEENLEKTLFEKLMEYQGNGQDMGVIMLDEQYRMHKKIVGFSGSYFYGDLLKSHESVEGKWLKKSHDHDWEAPLVFLDTATMQFEEQSTEYTKSKYNEKEADLIINHMEKMLTGIYTQGFLSSEEKISVGIIAPYKEQVRILQKKVNEELQIDEDFISVYISSIDGFQGQEKDIIYLSMVRSNERGNIGFLRETRRINVAMTRAKKKLIIIGNAKTLTDSNEPFYEKLINFIKENGSYSNDLRSFYR